MNIIQRCLLFAFVCVASSAFAQSPEAKLLAVLKSNAARPEKAEACRDLASVGTKEAVPPLAALLGDEQLAHMARYGLENIPDPAAGEALRTALGHLKGRFLTGVIASLGVRRDAQAVVPLTNLLGDADADVAAAAAMALGKIGTAPAVAALKPVLGKNPAAAEAMLRCAEAMPDQAASLYDAVRAAPVLAYQKMAATRGAILARGAAGLPLLLEQLRSNDPASLKVALGAGRELPGVDVTQALAAEIGKFAPEKQSLMLQMLGDRRDVAAAPALLAIAGGGAPEVRVVAIRALSQMGCIAAVPLLGGLAASPDAEVAKAAFSALAGFPGHEADAAIIALLNRSDAKLRAIGAELIGRRRITGALAELLRLTADADAQVSMASFKVLGEVGGANEIQPLLAILQKTSAPQAAEDALAAICSRQAQAVGAVVIQKATYGDLPEGPAADITAKVSELIRSGKLTFEVANANFGDPAGGRVKRLQVDYTVEGQPRSAKADEGEMIKLDVTTAAPVAVVEPLLAAYAQSQGAAKLSILTLLRSAGGAKALAVVRTAIGANDAALREAAQRALCDWPTAEVLPDLEKLAQTSSDAKFKILALRGYIRLIPLRVATPAANAVALKEAMGLCSRDEERRLALAALGNVPAPEALALAATYLDNASLKEEAGLAAVAIAESIAKSNPDQVGEVMKKVAKTSKNPAAVKRAKKLAGLGKKNK
jgi:HEAT repeat protein